MGLCLTSFLTTPDKPLFVTISLETLSFGLGQEGKNVSLIQTSLLPLLLVLLENETGLNSTGFQT
jgi:hypothetical protein